MEKLKNILKQHNIRPTMQRLAILDYMTEHRVHPTAEKIYEGIQRELPTLSLTTIYNTLHAFVENGLLKELLITANEVHYDLDGFPHHHFLCTECGEIFDLPFECCNHTTGIINGHHIIEMQGYFKGICRKCLNKIGEKENGS